MRDTGYFKQAKLLLQVLPYFEKQGHFALKGGTAINLFLREMPRLSVDIDLTYLPVNPRDEALSNISRSLKEVAAQVRKVLGAKVDEQTLKGTDYTVKMTVRQADATIKVEPNLVLRGSIYPPVQEKLCKKAEKEFELSVSTKVLSLADIYGGKICAALDRQHPRDFFDVKLLLEKEGLTDEIRRAFVVYLASHDRPMNELLKPKWKDIKSVFEKEFKGMTLEPVELNDLLETRDELLRLIHKGLKDKEKKFLLSLKDGEPDWTLLDLPNIERLPGLQWKLENIRRMSPKKRQEQSVLLRKALNEK
ncbi:MAG TPA: nucleotidyl transferase AbiEii/AbiGii toxin family protein [bacterium]|nr:nucleotidyl transferase AbiEii/AbiGii toxin family protein [bacterium]